MAVLPSARGQGIGKILFAEVQRFARAGGFQGMLLSTTPSLDDAIRLHECCGFVMGHTKLASTPLFTMEKDLRRP